MCGIVAIIARNKTGFYAQQADIFEEMLYASGLRGMDSTGVFSVSQKNQITIAKQAANPGIFIQTDSFKKFKSDMVSKGRIIVGHNRAATSGDITSKNAHPFMDRQIVLVHNGNISNAKALNKEVEVDSQSIITALADAATPIEGINKLFGAWAIVWYNREKKKLYFSRNKERPLYKLIAKDFIYLASEEKMLDWILERNFEFPEEEIKEVEPNVLYELTLNPYKIIETSIEKRSPIALPSATASDVYFEPAMNEESITHIKDIVATNLRDADAQTELGRARAKAAAEKLFMDPQERVLSFMKMYPEGSKVLFKPDRLIPLGQNQKQWEIQGRAWLPGSDVIPAFYVTDAKEDKEEYIDPIMPLVGTASTVQRRDKDIKMSLRNVHLPNTHFLTLNNVWFGAEEWAEVCNRNSCDLCAKDLNINMPAETVVVRENPGVYTCTCADCVTQEEAAKHMLKKETLMADNDAYAG